MINFKGRRFTGTDKRSQHVWDKANNYDKILHKINLEMKSSLVMLSKH